MTIEQLAWDFADLGVEVAEPLYYQWGDGQPTHCRDCRRTLKGRWTSCQSGADQRGQFAVCDDCGRAAAAAYREAAPYLGCGRHKTTWDDDAHATECLGMVCTFCGLSEPTGRQLVQEHNCVFWDRMGYGMCLLQRNAWERVGCCISCRSYTWGKPGGCHNGACKLAEVPE